MKKILYILLVVLFVSPFAYSHNGNEPKTKSNESAVVSKLELFIKEKKFQADEVLMYPGISSKSLKNKLTELINESAKDFMQVAISNPSDENYQSKIKSSLERFTLFNSELSSEDQDRVYHYYEELIDIIGLKNQGNHLKNWRYGSSTSTKKQI